MGEVREYGHFAREAGPYSVEGTILRAPFGTVLASVEELLDVTLPIWEDEWQSREGLLSIEVYYWISQS